MGQRASRFDTLLGVGDGGGLDCADPDRQVALTLAFAKQHDRLVGRHLDPDAHHVNWLHARSLPPRRGPGRLLLRPRRSGPSWPSPARHAGERSAPPTRGSPPRHDRGRRPHVRADRRDDLLDQPGLAVGRRLERTQVTRLDAVGGQLTCRLGDHDGVTVELLVARSRPRSGRS